MSAGCVRCDVMHARNAIAVGPLRRTCEIHARPLPTTRSTTSDTVVAPLSIPGCVKHRTARGESLTTIQPFDSRPDPQELTHCRLMLDEFGHPVPPELRQRHEELETDEPA